MSESTGIIKRTPASVLDLLKQVESHWPVREDTSSPNSTYRQWYSKAHKAVSTGLMTLSCSSWDLRDRTEESKERDFPADEFNELKDCLVQSLRPLQLGGGHKLPVIEELTIRGCEEVMEEVEDDSASPALVNFPLLLIKLSKQLCTNSNHGNEKYSVHDYIRITESTGLRGFQRYLFESLREYWSSATVLQRYEILSDLLGIEWDTSQESHSPVQVYRILEKDFDLAHREGQGNALSEETLDELEHPPITAALYDVYRLHSIDFPLLMPTVIPGRRVTVSNAHENEPLHKFDEHFDLSSGPSTRAGSHARSRSRSLSPRSRPPLPADSQYRQRDYDKHERGRRHSHSRSPPPSPPSGTHPLARHSHSLAHLSPRKQAIYALSG